MLGLCLTLVWIAVTCLKTKQTSFTKHLKSLKETSANAALFPESIGSLKGNTHFVDNKKVATHHAIVPNLPKIQGSRRNL